MKIEVDRDKYYLLLEKVYSLEWKRLRQELDEKYEDCEEPKEYWCIDWAGGINHITVLDDVDEYEENKKEIGNYFETREEAEKAVEKLKAWKRLKDKGFRLTGYSYYDWNGDEWPHISFSYPNFGDLFNDSETVADLDLLFSGEEK